MKLGRGTRRPPLQREDLVVFTGRPEAGWLTEDHPRVLAATGALASYRYSGEAQLQVRRRVVLPKPLSAQVPEGDEIPGQGGVDEPRHCLVGEQ